MSSPARKSPGGLADSAPPGIDFTEAALTGAALTSLENYVAAALKALLRGDQSQLQGGISFLAESGSFIDHEEQANYATLFNTYQASYHAMSWALAARLGPPTRQTQSHQAGHPAWSLGEQATLWEDHVPPVYLSFWRQDDEMPIYIVLALCGYQAWQQEA